MKQHLPFIGAFRSGHTDTSERVDELLRDGFGERPHLSAHARARLARDDAPKLKINQDDLLPLAEGPGQPQLSAHARAHLRSDDSPKRRRAYRGDPPANLTVKRDDHPHA